ncbi:MAG: hypothetical protein RIS79_3056 [Verrucomicrobiota bacterium]
MSEAESSTPEPSQNDALDLSSLRLMPAWVGDFGKEEKIIERFGDREDRPQRGDRNERRGGGGLVGIVALVAEVVLVNVVLEGAAARGRAVMVPEGRHVEIVVMARAEVRVVSAIVTVAAKEAVISVPSVSGCRSRRTSR